VTCFSFYANKTITTGEGGMAVTDTPGVAERMRRMSLHGLSRNAWLRYSDRGSWDYDIMAPGFKYNLTDIAAAIGLHQLARAEEMRQQRERIALRYREAFGDIEEIVLPAASPNCLHAWHLFPILLHLERLMIDRQHFIDELRQRGVTPSVHWRPLHMHAYYQRVLGYRPEDCPMAAARFWRVISLPIFSAMTDAHIDHVIWSIHDIVARHRRTTARRAGQTRTAAHEP
jgi:perosamine synthetase